MELTDFVTLGRSGLRVSPLCFGTMTFGIETGWGMEETEAATLFDAYIERGGNFFDTANNYAQGSSERILGNLLKQRAFRDRAVVATKFTRSCQSGDPNAVGNGRKALLRSLEESLSRLQTDYIDLYWLHSWDMVTPVEEVVETLQDLVAAGKIRYFGLSDVPAWYAARAQSIAEHRGGSRIVALQMEYSLIERSIEREHLPAMQELGMALCAWSPLGSGFLTGKYHRDDALSSSAGRLGLLGSAFRSFGDKEWRVLDVLEQVANELDLLPSQVALNWVIHRPGSTSPIIGARSLAQLESNLSAISVNLPDEAVQQLNQVSALEMIHPYKMYHSPIAELLSGDVNAKSWQPAKLY